MKSNSNTLSQNSEFTVGILCFLELGLIIRQKLKHVTSMNFKCLKSIQVLKPLVVQLPETVQCADAHRGDTARKKLLIWK